jgi:uncharacterized membrane protein YedE/YeeE
MKILVPTLCLALPSLASAAEIGVRATNYDGGAWSPYLVGACLGVLAWLTFYFADEIIGASSFYATLAGLLGKLVAKRHTESLRYYQSNPPLVDYGFVFVVCTILGGFISAWTGGEFRNEWLHPMWVDRFGDNVLLRGSIGFTGGILMAFGARLAGGCTSGHGISGTLQLDAGSWLAVICMFLGGIGTAFLLFTAL